MNKRVYISDLTCELHYKDRRSVRRWCCNNNVRILSDIGSNKQYVLKDEYEKAKCENYSKSQEFYSKINFSTQYHNKIEKKKLEYFPRFENEKRMLSILQNITSTL
jgi:hypothetical protein